MLSIILTGHGGFASGMEKAMKQILGEQSQFIAIDFPETSSTALLTSQLEEAIAEMLPTLKINKGEPFGSFKKLTMEDAAEIYRLAL